MDPGRRRELTRYGAPAAFLLAVTVAVLLVKAGLDNSGSSQDTVVSPTTTSRTTTQATSTKKLVLTGTLTSSTVTPGAQYYVIQSGDTLGGIAARYHTTVEQLLTLNPSVDPNALHPGDRIQVG